MTLSDNQAELDEELRSLGVELGRKGAGRSTEEMDQRLF